MRNDGVSNGGRVMRIEDEMGTGERLTDGRTKDGATDADGRRC